VTQALAAGTGIVTASLDLKTKDVYASGTFDLRSHRADITLRGFVATSNTGLEFFRAPGRLLSRGISQSTGCWWPASPSWESYFASDDPPQVSILNSARATSANGAILRGSVLAVDLFGLIDSRAGLRAAHILPPPGARVRGTFTVGGLRGITFRTTLEKALASLGTQTHYRGRNLWTVSLEPTTGSGPVSAPAPEQVLTVQQTDPTWRAQLNACDRRTQ
jgi:hypothetical protein